MRGPQVGQAPLTRFPACACRFLVHSDARCRSEFAFPALIQKYLWEASREAQSAKGAFGPRGATGTESAAPTRRKCAAHSKLACGGGKSMRSRRWRSAAHRRRCLLAARAGFI